MWNTYLLSLLLLAAPAAAAGSVSFRQLAGPTIFVGGPPVISRGIVAFVGPGGAVWTINADGTGLKRVIDPTTAIPGNRPPVPFADPAFTPFNIPAGDSFWIGYANQLRVGAGTVVFAATDPGKAGALSGFGLYSVPASGGSVTALASANYFPFDFQVSDQGQVVFEYASQVYSVPASGGPIITLAANKALAAPPSLVVNSGSTVQANQYAYPAISGDAVVLAAGNNISGGSIQTTSIRSPGTFADIADGRQFDVFTFVEPKIDGSTVIFGAQKRSGAVQGIYASSGAGQLTTLVDSTMDIPGGAGKFALGGNGHGPQIAVSDGIVVFEAHDATGNPGIYQVAETGGPITKVLATGDMIGIDKVQDVDMSAQPLSGGKLALSVALRFDHYLYVADLAATTPALNTDGTGVMNGATNLPNSSIVAGSWVTIKGANFSDTIANWSNLDFSKGLPTTLNGVQVLFNGTPAATYYIQNNQINVQAPSNVPASGTVSVQVVRDNVASNSVTAMASATAPGIFPYTLDGKTFYPAAVFVDGTLVGDPAVYASARKAKAGDWVLLFTTGMGVSPAGVLVTPTPFTPDVQVLIDTIPATVSTTYLVAPGEWQTNMVIPPGLSDGNHQIVVRTGGVSSQPGIVIPITH